MQGSLLPFLHEASRHLERTLEDAPVDLEHVRLAAARDLAELARAEHARAPHAARVAAELLYLAEALERRSGCAPREATECAGDARADAETLCALSHPLSQDDVALALAHLKALAESRGIDLVQALAVTLKCERVRGVMRHANAKPAGQPQARL
jgi:hypothetical protein